MDLKLLLPLIILQALLLIIALVDIIRRDSSRIRGPKVIWVLVSIFIQMFGPLAYLIFGRKKY
ncbi:phospholipase D-like protein [Paenibacillus cellulosilyticus]|uniref:Phospholipase D-like protein n=1 Tax=Paenibacillus cellulosilyticus TaxID=375489 RepID=A0A2V2YLT0_9BACL|nr:PLD nuclease N-terminal domain-containing protein [Paenibacillus cellulosilyticus]PWV94536.1 phospholipase D-like protein [Paenibacillus cellulosilyticus]QKS45040.1 PLDc_N domain-containing protein [Paenibacillus cellulosilyticus]